MAIKYTADEKSALLNKAENPENDVVCPRCRKLLQYKAVLASYEVKCQTDGCLKMVVRGL